MSSTSWLGGLIQGSGSLAVGPNGPVLTLNVTDKKTATAVVEALNEVGIPGERFQEWGKRGLKISEIYRLRISNPEELKKLFTEWDLELHGPWADRATAISAWNPDEDFPDDMASTGSLYGNPIDNITWVGVEKLWANAWNPNFVFSPEMKLLKESIMRTKWIQPILVNANFMIIDGFHRSLLCKSDQEVADLTDGCVPCSILDIDDAEAMMMTVRINRAKGTHTAFKMSELVQQLVDDYGKSPDEISVGIGATLEEVDLLYKGGVFKKRDLDRWEYSKAWIPVYKDAEEEVSFERDASTAEDVTSS